MTRLMTMATVLVSTIGVHGDPPVVRDTAHVDASGSWIEREHVSVRPRPRPARPQPVGAGIIWHLTDSGSITESVAVADSTDESWVGHNLNFERLGYHQTTGTATPIYEYDLVGESPDRVVTASAETVSLGVVMSTGAGGVHVRAFNSVSGNTPIWTYSFPEEYTAAFIRALDVAADGSIVAAIAYVPGMSQSLLVILDGASGAELSCLPIAAFAQAVELSDDGTRAMITQSSTAIIVETAGLTTLFAFNVSGGGGYHRLSRDGTVAAAGGFNLLAYREISGVWTQVWNQTQANNWFGYGVALSANGDTLFVVQHNYATGYLELTYRVIDLDAGVELASTTTLGTGAFQDSVVGAQASANGEVLLSASWGSQDNAHPEVQIWDRDLNLIGSIDTPGSPFSIDMTGNGQFVLVGCKAVHANTSGNGSDTYSYGVAVSCPWDCGAPDLVVSTPDLLALLAQWGGLGPCDFDGSGAGTTDLLKMLANWGPCP